MDLEQRAKTLLASEYGCSEDELTADEVSAAMVALRSTSEVPQFPTMLRKMWSGGEVQEWLNQYFGARK